MAFSWTPFDTFAAISIFGSWLNALRYTVFSIKVLIAFSACLTLLSYNRLIKVLIALSACLALLSYNRLTKQTIRLKVAVASFRSRCKVDGCRILLLRG
jgi:hypothetical protein